MSMIQLPPGMTPEQYWASPQGQRTAEMQRRFQEQLGSPRVGGGASREDNIRRLAGRQPVSAGKGPPQGKPPKPKPPEGNCYPGCNPDGSPTYDRMCRRQPDPNCRPGRPTPLGPQLPAGMTPYDIKGTYQR